MVAGRCSSGGRRLMARGGVRSSGGACQHGGRVGRWPKGAGVGEELGERDGLGNSPQRPGFNNGVEATRC
jgi:hypothetical protein